MRGTVLVAETDRSRRILVGRVLRNAGYSVTFAVSGEDLNQFVQSKPHDVVVASSALIDSPREFVEGLRQNDGKTLVVVTTPPREIKK